MKVNLVEVANQKVRVERVLSDLFDIYVPEGAAGWKVHCPIGYEHRDGGTSKNMRVYAESNSAWCFSHGMRFDPVILWQLHQPTHRKQAALKLMEHYGVDWKPPTLEERWNRLNEKEQEAPTSAPELAVQMMLRTLPDYGTKQFDPEVMRMVGLVYEDVISNSPHDSYDELEHRLEGHKKELEKYWKVMKWI